METTEIQYVLTTRAINLTLHNKYVRQQVAKLLGMQDRGVSEILRTNRPNNSLTLTAGVEAISKETGLQPEDILQSFPIAQESAA